MITRTRALGRRILFFTNNTSRSPLEYVERLNRMGLAVTRADILTAGDVTVHYLRQHHPDARVFLLGVPALRESFAAGGIRLVEEDPDLVVAGFDKTLTYERLEKACIFLRRGAGFLATHPDINCPTEAEPIPDCGAICQLIANATGRAPEFIGKPDPTMIQLALEQTGYAPAQALMVGDRLYTDIACGVNAGTDTALVLTGEATAADAAVSDTPPTLICRDMAELLERLKEAGK